jgi:hypothetical protein
MDEKKIIAIKEISRKRKKDIEMIKNKIINVREFTFKDLEEFLSDIDIYDDCENAWFTYGVAISFGDEICFVKVSNLIRGLKTDIDNDNEDGWIKEKKDWIKKLKKYDGFTIEERKDE